MIKTDGYRMPVFLRFAAQFCVFLAHSLDSTQALDKFNFLISASSATSSTSAFAVCRLSSINQKWCIWRFREAMDRFLSEITSSIL